MPNIFCPTCNSHTEHTQFVDRYATKCNACGTVVAGQDRTQTEANKYIAPDGNIGTVVKNNEDTIIFSVEQGQHRGYYIYNKKTGFGAVQMW